MLLPAIVGLACVLAVLAVALVALNERQRRLDGAVRDLSALTRLLEGHAQGALLTADIALQGVVEGMERDPGRPAHDPAFENSLRRALRNLPVIRALFVVGPDGFITQDSDRATPRRNLADRDYFRAHQQADGGDGLFVGKPWISRSTGTWFIGVSRPLKSRSGAFQGVAVAALETRFLERTYRDLDLGDSDVIGLLSPDGVVVARHPHAEGTVGEPLSAGVRSALLDALRRSPSGTFGARGAGGRDRIFAYRSLPDTPLVVLVGRARADVLASWRRSVVVAGGVTILALGLGVLLCWMLIAQARDAAFQAAHLAEAERLEALGRLSSGVAHDFNNLLQSLSASLSLLGKRAGSDARAKVVIEQGLGSIERGRALVAQLLGVARRHDITARPVDINVLLTNMESLVRNAAAPCARVEFRLDPDLPTCRVDPSRLDAAILNLVVNARDALPPDNADAGWVRISTHACEGLPGSATSRAKPGAFVCLTVTDNGAGMTPGIQRRALEPFFTTKGEAGTGLGLSQVRAFVRDSGGDIEIESETGAGTAVRLYLPCG